MKGLNGALRIAAAASLAVGGSLMLPTPAHAAGTPVFDATNYAENLVQAARALDQINNQIASLQNEAAMLRNMATNLQQVDFPQLGQITSAMQRIDALMQQGSGIDFRVSGLDQRIRTVFPGALQRALASDERISEARAQLDAATSAFRQGMSAQAHVAENVQEDAGLLAELAATSQNAAGALEVGQAANQLLALSVKQQLQLQNLMASEFREQSLDRARRVQAEEDGRVATRRFIDGPPRS